MHVSFVTIFVLFIYLISPAVQAVNTTLLLLSFLLITSVHTESGNSTCFKTTLTSCDRVFLWLYLLAGGNLTRADMWCCNIDENVKSEHICDWQTQLGWTNTSLYKTKWGNFVLIILTFITIKLQEKFHVSIDCHHDIATFSEPNASSCWMLVMNLFNQNWPLKQYLCDGWSESFDLIRVRAVWCSKKKVSFYVEWSDESWFFFRNVSFIDRIYLAKICMVNSIRRLATVSPYWRKGDKNVKPPLQESFSTFTQKKI